MAHNRINTESSNRAPAGLDGKQVFDPKAYAYNTKEEFKWKQGAPEEEQSHSTRSPILKAPIEAAISRPIEAFPSANNPKQLN